MSNKLTCEANKTLGKKASLASGLAPVQFQDHDVAGVTAGIATANKKPSLLFIGLVRFSV